jgi:hypothetical protein
LDIVAEALVDVDVVQVAFNPHVDVRNEHGGILVDLPMACDALIVKPIPSWSLNTPGLLSRIGWSRSPQWLEVLGLSLL